MDNLKKIFNSSGSIKIKGEPDERKLGRKRSRSDVGAGSSPGNFKSDKSESSEDIKSIDHFKRQNLDRDQFGYSVLSDISWWPDEILLFLEVLRISYQDFINPYMSTANTFDTSIRNAIYFMNQKKYNKIPDIEKFVKCGNFEIPDNYLNLVISEDNCYMHELEERKRSVNETKHYLLSRALDKLISLGGIYDGDLVFKKEHESAVRMYLIIYNIRNAYAVVDDTLRLLLRAALDKNKMDIQIYNFVYDLINDLDERVITHLYSGLSWSNPDLDGGPELNNKLFGKIYIFRDLLLYTLHNSLNFNHTFTFKRDITRNLDGIEALSPLRNNKYNKFFNDEVVNRIEYVYKYYLGILAEKFRKNEKLLNGTDFDSLRNESDKSNILTPRYTFKSGITQNERSSNIFIIDLSNIQWML